MSRPLQTVCSSRACATLLSATAKIAASNLCRLGMLFGRVFRRERLQTIHPQDCDAFILLLKHRDACVRTHVWIDPVAQNLAQVLRLVGGRFVSKNEDRAETEKSQGNGRAPEQAANRTP